ncbi:MAG: N-acetylneuraminate synthase family protein [Candidatus Saganbacteria bacterium]|nr:N-acetylneuraminate synthase family protein [Candidatus Saganbacteria bacterium]
MRIFVIAEIGINHNGSVEIAKQLIDVAKVAGADAVKFQKRTVEKVYSKEELDKPRESPWGTTTREQKLGLELGRAAYDEIDRYCREKGIEWFASAWDRESQAFLHQYNLKHNKVASAMMPDLELLRQVAAERKHTFISTGMCDLEMVDRAVEIFKKANCPFELMHCVSTYPTNDEDANLNCIPLLRDRYRCDVGYSGHEGGIAVSYAAAALGITSLERHITLDRAMYGSDQAVSLEPATFVQMIGGLRKIEKAMGDGVKKMQEKEVPIAKKLRSHIRLESHE